MTDEELIKVALLRSNDPKFVAEQITSIIHVMVDRMKPESRNKALPNIGDKIKNLNVLEMSNKRHPGGASIGTSISIVKNILNGRDPYFIKLVVDELVSNLQ